MPETSRPLSENRAEADFTLRTTLTHHYGRFGEANVGNCVDMLIESCAEWPLQRVVDAIKAHTRDTRAVRGNQTVGSYLPNLSQVIAHAEHSDKEKTHGEGEFERRLQRIAEQEKDAAFRSVDAGEYGVFHVLDIVSECLECSDTGKAKFYYNLTDMSEVYLFSEWLESVKTTGNAPGAGPMRMASAICDCELGLLRPARSSAMNYKGHDVPLQSRLEVIRRLAEVRAQAEREEIDA
jgi:hypothetical protein